MTPSEWHDQTRGRDAGHDQMQIDVWQWLTDNPPPVKNEGREYRRRKVIFEACFEHTRTITCFADICEVFDATEKLNSGHVVQWTQYRAYEIKPVISSVGGLIRQLAALSTAIESAVTASKVTVLPVVRLKDPKFDLLLRVCPFWAYWDDNELTFVTSRE